MISLLQLTPYSGATVAPSPNHGDRRAPAIEGIVLHATADAGNEAGTLDWMRSPKSRVSCHLLVSRFGDVTRLVGDRHRAWHAGRSFWRQTSDVNSITLGIEIANRNDGEPYSDQQYDRVAEIVAHYCRQGLTLGDVVGHGEIARQRTDPLGWDWERFQALVMGRLRPEQPRRSSALGVVVNTVAPARRSPVAGTMSPQRAAAIAGPGLFYFGRTIWLHGLTALAVGCAIVGEALDLASIQLSLPEQVTLWVLFAVSVVNFFLRGRRSGK